MLDKLNKIKWLQLPTMTINTHNELSYNNSKFENLQKEIVKFQKKKKLSITRYIQVIFLLIFVYKFFNDPLKQNSQSRHCIYQYVMPYMAQAKTLPLLHGLNTWVSTIQNNESGGS